MRRFFARLMVGCMFLGIVNVMAPHAQRPVHASVALAPFISGWSLMDTDVHFDEPEPTGSLHQLVEGEKVFVWDRPMSVYPQMIKLDSGVQIGVSFPTPQGKAVAAIWWCDDPRLESAQKHLDRKDPFKGLPADLKWTRVEGAEIEGGEWRFRYMPKTTGLNVVRVIGLIVDAKEISRHPLGKLIPWKWGDYKDQLRGAQVRFIARASCVPGTQRLENCLLGRDGKLNAKRVVQTLVKIGSGGSPIPLDWENELGPEDAVAAYGTPSTPGVTPREGPRGNGTPRFAKATTTSGDPRWVTIVWPDGSQTAAFEADGKPVGVPDEFTTFQILVHDKGQWIPIRPTWDDGVRRDYYPAPNPGKTIEITLTPPK